MMEFDTDKASLKKISEELRHTTEVLRFMIVTKEMKSAEEMQREADVHHKIAIEQEEREKAREKQETVRPRRERRKPLVVQQKIEEKPKPVETPVASVAVSTTEEKPLEPKSETPEKAMKQNKVALEDLDKKLDELLDDTII